MVCLRLNLLYNFHKNFIYYISFPFQFNFWTNFIELCVRYCPWISFLFSKSDYTLPYSDKIWSTIPPKAPLSNTWHLTGISDNVNTTTLCSFLAPPIRSPYRLRLFPARMKHNRDHLLWVLLPLMQSIKFLFTVSENRTQAINRQPKQ